MIIIISGIFFVLASALILYLFAVGNWLLASISALGLFILYVVLEHEETEKARAAALKSERDHDVAEHNVRFLTHELANAECVIDAEQAGRKKAEAEVEALRAIIDNREAIIATHAADTREYQKQIMHAEARAERLAEALRLIAAPMRPDGSWNRDREACRQIARDALRDHEQEVGNG